LALKNVPINNVSVSIVVPCLNEEKFIEQLINNILEQDYPTELRDVIFIDGNSEDRTLDILNKYEAIHKEFKVIHNPKKYVPFGLNQAIQSSDSDVILRMDVHSIYPINYVSKLVHHLYDLEADNVGGVWDIQPGNESSSAKAIAFTNGHQFGIGNASYRFVREGIKEADTVPFGCYRREVFEKIGYFDEELIRSEDDELNARLLKHGGKIFLIPSLQIKYFARPNFGKMSQMFFQYGLFKPFANKKVGELTTLRQLVPSLLILGTIFGMTISLYDKRFWPLLLFPWFLYILIASIISIAHLIRTRDLKTSLLIPYSFLLIHLSYGWGYLKGLLLVLIGKTPRIVRNSR